MNTNKISFISIILLLILEGIPVNYLSAQTGKLIPAKIDGNNISTWYYQDGSFNNDLFTKHPVFEWPKGSGKYARYLSGLVIGAQVNTDTLIATVSYGGGEFLPGYTSDNGNPMGSDDPVYKIYKLMYGVTDSNRMYWPNLLLSNSNQGAPVYFNSFSGMWEPNDYGNQTMFFRMTDSYPDSHIQDHTLPLKADIKCINFTFHTHDALDNVIYSHYEIINRSTSVWRNTFFTFFSDDEANDFVGYVGCDTLNNLGYSYCRLKNPVYGINGPAVGFKIIRGANYFTGNANDSIFYYEGKNKKIKYGYKSKGMHSFNWFHDDGPPNYRFNYMSMEGKHYRTGNPIITPDGDTTRYYFTGNPETNTGWVMNVNSASYRRTYTTTGPVNVNPGETQHIVVAQVIAQGVTNLNSVTKLKEASAIAEQHYNNFFEGVPINVKNISSIVPENFFLYQNYPNPFNPTTTIKFDLAKQSFVTLKLYDVLGKELVSMVNEELNSGQYEYKLFSDKFNLSSGTYFYQINVHPNRSEAVSFVQSKKLIVLK